MNVKSSSLTHTQIVNEQFLYKLFIIKLPQLHLIRKHVIAVDNVDDFPQIFLSDELLNYTFVPFEPEKNMSKEFIVL